MIILGLGSNSGDRLDNLRGAYLALKKNKKLKIIAASPLYQSDALLPKSADQDWNRFYLNLAIQIETSLSPLECLHQIKEIEKNLGRKKSKRWAPRVIDIDILAWEEKVIESDNLTIPHLGLCDRPFALWPLADLAPNWIFPCQRKDKNQTAAMLVEKWGSRFAGDAPFHTKQIHQRIDTPILMGIVNVTPDSFSDGDQFLQSDFALQKAYQLIEDGAEILDIGAESTAPHAAAITEEIEWARLLPVLLNIIENKNNFLIPPKISIDTRHPNIAQLALELGVDLINDVSGLTNPNMRKIIAKNNTDCVIMHHVSVPASNTKILPLDSDPVSIVYEWAEKQINFLIQEGIKKEKIIFDPGIGFGKSAEHSLILIKNIEIFSALGVRILVGHSRKSFMRLFSNKPAKDRDIETMIITLLLANKHIDYVRVHNINYCARGLKTWCMLR
jgi:2-amino-4-hydroxy-6-hydroxymethyldihydropteridine diphosphokinase/dihydropteroate synthase